MFLKDKNPNFYKSSTIYIQETITITETRITIYAVRVQISSPG